MNTETGKKAYRRPTLTSERVFEQAALSCVVRNLGVVQTTLKINQVDTGCGFTSS